MIIVDTALEEARAGRQTGHRRHGRCRLHGARHRAADPHARCRACASSRSRTATSRRPSGLPQAGIDAQRAVGRRGGLEQRDRRRTLRGHRRSDGAVPGRRHRGDHRDDRRRRVRRAGRARRDPQRQARHPDERRGRRLGRPDPQGLRRPRRRRLHLHRRRRAGRRDEPVPVRRRASATSRCCWGRSRASSTATAIPDTQRDFAEKHGQKPAMVASFADGSKLALESAIIGNATGFVPGIRGMYGHDCAHVKDLLTKFYAGRLRERRPRRLRARRRAAHRRLRDGLQRPSRQAAST